MNPKAMGAGLGVVVIVVIACLVLLGGEDGVDPIDVGSPTGSATVGQDPTSPVGVSPGPSGTRSPGVQLDPIDPVVNGGNGSASPRNGGGDPRVSPSTTPTGLAGQGRLTLHCRDSAGDPLNGVNVSARRASGAPLPSVLSGGQGTAELLGIPSGEKIQGEARHPLFKDTVSWGPVEVGRDVELVFVRSPVGNLKGRIVDSNGEGLRDAELVIVDPKQEGESILDPLAMGLGPDGSFWAEVAAGQYAVSARGPGFSPSDQNYLTVPEGGEANAGDLVVLGQGGLAGTVALPADLTAVLPARVELVVEIVTGSEANPVTRVQRHPLAVDASMRWELPECDPGRIRLRLEIPQAGGNRVGGWEAIMLEPGKRVDGINLGLQEVMVAIRGVVRDDQGVPLGGAEVICGSRRVTTDRDGTYSLRGLDLGEVFVEVHYEAHGVGFQKVDYQGATVQADFDLPRAGGARGEVLDADGNPAANVPVQVVQRQEDGGVRPTDTQTDTSGFYEVLNLDPGRYYVRAGPGNPWDDAGAPNVTIRPGETVDVPQIRMR